MPITLRVRELRLTRGWSLRELARRADVRPNTVSDIENGRTRGVDFVTLEKLAQVFEVDPGYLIVRGKKWPSPGGSSPTATGRVHVSRRAGQ